MRSSQKILRPNQYPLKHLDVNYIEPVTLFGSSGALKYSDKQLSTASTILNLSLYFSGGLGLSASIKITGAPGFMVDFQFPNSIKAALTAVPEPAPMVCSACFAPVAAGMVVLRRRAAGKGALAVAQREAGALPQKRQLNAYTSVARHAGPLALNRRRFATVRSKRVESFSVGTSCPPWLTRMATRCSEVSIETSPMKQRTTVYPDCTASPRNLISSPKGSDRKVSKMKLSRCRINSRRS
jgi:hypothetical protein